MRVLMVGAEAFPYAKVGGLGDVLGALPKALAAEGADVTLILPKYRQVSAAKHDLERVPVPDGWSVGLHFVNHGFGLLRGTIPGSTATVLFIENTYRPIGICFRSPDGDAAVGGFGGRRQGQ